MFESLRKTFTGGAHPKEEKELTQHLPFEVMPVTKQIILPLSQHIGKPAKALVAKGAVVKAGQVIAEAQGFISSPIYATASGNVTKITTSATVSGTPKESLLITTNEDTDVELLTPLSFETVTADEIKQRVKDAGIVGQGGAAFPTFVKLSPPEGKRVDMVVINGAECEPYLTRDYRFMMERTEDVLRGLTLIMRAVGVTRGAIGIEDNKPDAIKALQSVVGRYPGITIEALPTKYPQGAEKMLIYSITKRVVPAGGLPMDVGVVVQNIGTAIAVLDAVVKGEPVLTAALTVTGRGIRTPRNLIVKIGTPIIEVINYCGGLTDDAVKVIVGGPMMGVAQYDLNAPVMKATSGIVVLAKGEAEKLEEYPCVRCGKCVDVCPLFLMPTKIASYSQLGRPEDAEKLGVMVCMECGTCAFSCPSGIPLVQWIKRGKKEVLKLQRERQSGN